MPLKNITYKYKTLYQYIVKIMDDNKHCHTIVIPANCEKEAREKLEQFLGNISFLVDIELYNHINTGTFLEGIGVESTVVQTEDKSDVPKKESYQLLSKLMKDNGWICYKKKEKV